MWGRGERPTTCGAGLPAPHPGLSAPHPPPRPIGVCLQRNGPDAPPTPVVLLPFMRHGDLHRFLLRCRLGERPVVRGGHLGGWGGSWG